MTRRELRMRRRRVRRAGLAVVVVGASAGLGALALPAGANGAPGRYYQCDPGPNTVGQSRSNNHNVTPGRSENACD